MKRLTDINEYYEADLVGVDMDKLCNKLDQNEGEKLKLALKKLALLENIEDEVGLDLYKLSEACEYGVYYKLFNGSICFIGQVFVDLYDGKIRCYDDEEYYFEFYFSDYGKTWALTREELEENKQ